MRSLEELAGGSTWRSLRTQWPPPALRLRPQAGCQPGPGLLARRPRASLPHAGPEQDGAPRSGHTSPAPKVREPPSARPGLGRSPKTLRRNAASGKWVRCPQGRPSRRETRAERGFLRRPDGGAGAIPFSCGDALPSPARHFPPPPAPPRPSSRSEVDGHAGVRSVFIRPQPSRPWAFFWSCAAAEERVVGHLWGPFDLSNSVTLRRLRGTLRGACCVEAAA